VFFTHGFSQESLVGAQVAGCATRARMAVSVPLLPHGSTTSRARKTRTAVALVLTAAAAAAACAVYTTTGSSAGEELLQYDAFVRRQRGAWDSLDERVLMPAFPQLRGARRASFTQLAPRSAGTKAKEERVETGGQFRGRRGRFEDTPLFFSNFSFPSFF
jgi:hypothetical protein